MPPMTTSGTSQPSRLSWTSDRLSERIAIEDDCLRLSVRQRRDGDRRRGQAGDLQQSRSRRGRRVRTQGRISAWGLRRSSDPPSISRCDRCDQPDGLPDRRRVASVKRAARVDAEAANRRQVIVFDAIFGVASVVGVPLHSTYVAPVAKRVEDSHSRPTPSRKPALDDQTSP